MACAAVASTIQCGPRLSLVPLLVAAAMVGKVSVQGEAMAMFK